MNVLDLFSGIGGFSLGLERAGMRTVGFVEIDPYAQCVIRKHWAEAPIWGDITKREFHEGEADVICGGFPCQDISSAGERAGITGKRSGLWRELLRAIRLVRPRYAIVENVAALLIRGMDTVLGDLAEIGYDAEWHCIPASAVGAPHRRDRVWIVANPTRIQQGWEKQRTKWERARQGSQSIALADAECNGCKQVVPPIQSGEIGERAASEIADRRLTGGRGWWLSEPNVGRVADGVSARVDRLRCLGNAVVPQIPEIIGRAILGAEKR
jgi:DNA (cytosine-5)-methyltransferase 1